MKHFLKSKIVFWNLYTDDELCKEVFIVPTISIAKHIGVEDSKYVYFRWIVFGIGIRVWRK